MGWLWQIIKSLGSSIKLSCSVYYIQQTPDNSNSDNQCSSRTRTKFPVVDQNFTEIFPDNSNSPLTRTVFRFPVEFELPGSTVRTYKAKFTQKCINQQVTSPDGIKRSEFERLSSPRTPRVRKYGWTRMIFQTTKYEVIDLCQGRTIRKVMGGERGIFELQEFFFVIKFFA